MKQILRYFSALTLLLLFYGSSIGQVSSVNYQMKYDTSTCLYDCYFIVNAGSATTLQRRTQGSSQFSIVVPTGTGIAIDTSYLPYYVQSGTDTFSQDWTINTSTIAPVVTPDVDYHSVTVALGPTSYYDNLLSGDTVKIFSVSIDTIVNCGQEIRIWDNDSDPQPLIDGSDGMGGALYNNGFTLGSVQQLYNENSTILHPPVPLIVSAEIGCSDGVEIDLTASTSLCQGDLSYEWTGPAAFMSTDEDVAINPATAANDGTYEVIITDEFGCKDSIEVEALGKPDAGADFNACAGSIDTLIGSPANGSWEEIAGNPVFGLNDLSDQGAGVGIVDFSRFASGTFCFEFSIAPNNVGGPVCSDTICLTIDPQPTTTISDNSICVGETTNLTAGPGFAGTWAANDPTIATVNSATGVVTGVAVGNARFTFTNTATGCQVETLPVTINGQPAVSSANPEVCVDGDVQANPLSGGTWTALTPALGTISASGLITGVTEGEAHFIFEETGGCFSDTLKIQIVGKPIVGFTGSDSICLQSNTQLFPNTGGTWTSLNELVATVNNFGLVTSQGPGITQFVFTSTASQCDSDPTGDLTVFDDPTVSIDGDDMLCIGATTQLSPNTGGTWTSSDPGKLSVDNTGLVTANENGFATFTFVDDITGCDATTAAVIVDGSPTVSIDSDDICITEETDLFPTSALGTWVALNPDTAMILGNGYTVRGVTAGTAGFIYTENSSGCKSDTVFVTVDPGPSTNISGDNEICVNETSQMQPSIGGVWVSNNPTVASINNAGFVVGLSAGTATFTYTDVLNGCASLPSDPITVTPISPTQFFGPTGICVGEFSQILPATGGTWVSTMPSVASIDDTGFITGLTPGTTRFIWTNSTTGCTTSESEPLTVDPVPTVSFTGPSEMCIGGTTTLSPTTGGVWTSSDPTVAQVTNAGQVTALGAGPVVFTFSQTGSDCESAGLNATVNPTPIITDIQDTTLCVGETSMATSDTPGGAWSSSNTSILTIDAAGVITAVAQGTATIRRISTSSCPSDPSIAITVNAAESVELGDDELCIGEMSTLTPSTGGTWVSSNPAVASVVAATGVVTAVAEGTAQFTFTSDGTSCTSGSTDFLTVNPTPEVLFNGSQEICIGETSQITPSIGGSWISSDPTIATINNQGLITGVNPGKVVFTFTSQATTCESAPSDSLEVLDGTPVSGGGVGLCIGDNTALSPNVGGTWTSNDPSVATVTPAGIVTAEGPGSATFYFTDAGGCRSQDTEAIVVNNGATIIIQGDDILCIGETTQMIPDTLGTWVSNSPLIASIDDTGLVTALATGTATFTFTDTLTGCVSLPSAPVTVNPAPDVEISGDTEICIGSLTTLSANGASGTWSSNDPAIATVDNNGVVTAIGVGEVTFSFIEASSGCEGGATTDVLTITACADPDFNVTYVDLPVPGDVSTNDAVAVGTTYGPEAAVVLTSLPAGATETLTLSPDGTYVFTGSAVGVYTYDVPVCGPGETTGCATAELTITVLDFLEPNLRPVANVDIGTTQIGNPITLATLENDRCVVTTGCSLDPGTVTILSIYSNGTQSVDPVTGDITYTPNPGFVGFDTLTYQVCVTGEPANCASADQIILVTALNADNTTQAADDFAATQQGEPVSGNVANNDSDAEGDNQNVTPQSTTVAAGTLVLNADGSYTFTPVQGFWGPVDFPYTTTDDNVDPATADATLHILVVKDLTLRLRVYLSGALINNRNEQATDGRPLMRDDLRVSPFNGARFIPDNDPYSYNSGYTPLLFGLPTIPDSFTHVGAGLRTDFQTIGSPASIFAVTGQDAIVDWVWVELRDKANTGSVVATRAALLQRDGDVVDLDGQAGVRVPGVIVDSYYVVVRHRNHLGAMTLNPQSPQNLAELVDFTVPSTPMWDYGTTRNSLDYTGLSQDATIKPNYLSLWGGNLDGSRKVKYDNPEDDLNTLLFDVLGYLTNAQGNINYDFSYGYLQGDFDMNSKSKYDNPDDDKNYLFLTVLLYPLNDGIFLSNFDLFFEQVPATD